MSLLKTAKMPEHLAALFSGHAATSPALAQEMERAAWEMDRAALDLAAVQRQAATAPLGLQTMAAVDVLLRTAVWEALKERYVQEVASRAGEGDLAERCAVTLAHAQATTSQALADAGERCAKLEALLYRYRYEVPLGYQPSMAPLEVDELLGPF
jgi:hypothetical protein